MNAQQVNELVGTPYGEDSFGPTSFNCWGLLHYVQRHYFYVSMPVAPMGDADACVQMFVEHMHSGKWTPIATPVHGSGALLREGTEPHVGIYLDIDGGGILHAVRGPGVIWTPIHKLKKAGYRTVKYYRLE